MREYAWDKNHLRQVSVLGTSQNKLPLCEFKLKWLQCKLPSSIMSQGVFPPPNVSCHVTFYRSCRAYWSHVCQYDPWDSFQKGVNSSPPGQSDRLFADDSFKGTFMNENVSISIRISLKFVPNGPIDYNPALVYIMAWCRICDKPLSEPMQTLFTDTYTDIRHWRGVT